MNFATWSIRRPIPVIVGFTIAALAGMFAFARLPIQDMPDITLPGVIVTAQLESAAPSQLETEVTRKIEDAVASVPEVRHISSVIRTGSSVTSIEFELSKDTSDAVNEVRDAIARVRSDLPQNLREPIIEKITTAGAIRTYSVHAAGMDEERLSWFVDNVIARRLMGVSGVGAVPRVGGVDREIHIDLDPAQLAAFNVTAADVSRALRRVQQESSGGIAKVGSMRQSVRTVGTLSNIDDLQNLELPLSERHTVRLGRIADVKDTIRERSQLALLDGRPVVAFQIVRARGASEVSVAREAEEALEEIRQAHRGVEIELVEDNVAVIEQQYDGSMQMLIEGALLAMVVVALFLRNWSATWIAAVALPLSVLPAFAAMYWMGFSLNTVTLLALTLVIGVLVDDAIVEVENIERHLRPGVSIEQAAMSAVNEIGLAVIATTLTLVAVFLPTAFMGGVPGKFFVHFGWTATAAVLASLAVARLLTPMLAARYLKPAPAERSRSGPWLQRYLDLVAYSLQHRRLTLLVAAILFFASLALIPLLPGNFMPPTDRGQTQIAMELPPGAKLEQVHDLALQVTQVARGLPQIDSVFAAIGSQNNDQGPGERTGVADLRRTTFSVKLAPRDQREESQMEVENLLRQALAAIPGARFTVRGEDSGDKLTFALASADGELLETTALSIERELRTLPGLVNVRSTASLQQPQLIVTPSFARAAQLGVDAESIGETLRVASGGDFSWSLAKFTLPERQLDVRVQLPEEYSTDLRALAALHVPGKLGLAPLASVADLALRSGPDEIHRFDRQRSVTIEAELHGVALAQVMSDISRLPSVQTLPAAVHKLDTGDAEQMAEILGGFGFAILTGIVCIYLILVVLFHDFLQPLTILSALPFALGGAFVALLVTGHGFSLPSLLGLLMLMGVVTKNSILLVDYALTAMRRDHLPRAEALLVACRLRARPILMTTLAMAAGMLPVAIGVGDLGFRTPMAVAVIGGLITSTLLSLVLVPVVFSYVDDLRGGS
ncbi:efflux RND transporter permease subunit [Steroidobacter sp. S1-65]|uniref:Efflux RND transporter permease subunit n=1 Tax=Steroidobacter gossypii TaxID=2805490 RepID=A0ABS1X347_9GAMM|nr:efflux RND transporter permease subunit [Steroidobacter gossypii]MBM0107654.1 efflux RND transporter permease subunit [Steroidobacter gossypii]